MDISISSTCITGVWLSQILRIGKVEHRQYRLLVSRTKCAVISNGTGG